MFYLAVILLVCALVIGVLTWTDGRE